jgi:cell division protein FtsI/penicillin-binding protein 2
MTTDVFEPGSAMKPIIISTAFDYGIVTPHTKFDCENGYWREMRLRDSHRMGVSSVAEILIESSNIGTAKIAMKMGKPILFKMFRRFGFGKHTGIPLRPEATSYVRNPKYWDYLSISRFSIGQGIAVTPLQLVRAYCAIANGGDLVKLRLVDRVRDTRTGEFIKKPYGSSNKVYLHAKTSREIVKIMCHVTKEGGTATRAAIPGFEVAGKTGTSQKWVPANKKEGIRGHYSEKRFFATFAGFVPALNPAFVLAVIVDEPHGNHYGGVVAAPTFKKIAEKTLGYMNIQPNAISIVNKN